MCDRKITQNKKQQQQPKTIKKSTSLKFDNIEHNNSHLNESLSNENLDRKTRLKQRNSFDNSYILLEDNENDVDADSVGVLKTATKKYLNNVKSPFKIFKDETSSPVKPSTSNSVKVKTSDCQVQCDLGEEYDYDELESEFNEEELEIKRNNPTNYHKMIAEKLRENLYDHLQENMELHKLKDELNDEQHELVEEKKRLFELIEQAQEVVKSFNELEANSTVNDSGIQ